MAETHSHRNLYLAALVASFTAALFGYSVGFIGGILVLPSFLHHFGLDGLPAAQLASASSNIVSAWLVGALLGVPLGMPVCSRSGKRACLILSATLYVFGVALQLIDVQSLALFDIGRFINGLGVGAGTLVSPMYIAEIATPSTRGMLLSGYQTVLQFFALIGFWAAFSAHSAFPDSSSLQWQIPIALQLLPGVPLLLGALWIPESPRFLAESGLSNEAEDVLAWLRASTKEDMYVQDELREIQTIAEITGAAQARSRGFWSETRSRSVRKRLALGIGLMMAQNMVGLNALNYYAPKIFMSAGFTSVSSSLFLTGLFGAIKLISALSFMFVFVHMKGNRFWLRFGSLVCGITMLVLAVCVQRLPISPDQRGSTVSSLASVFTLGFSTSWPGSHSVSEEASNYNAYGIISVFMVYIFAFAFGLSLGPISWNVCSEIFPAHIKAKCCAITTCTQWLFQIVIAGVTPYLLAKVGWATYLVYAVCCLITLIWVHYFVPETQGVSLGRAMDELFGPVAGHDQTEAMVVVDESTALLQGSTGGHARRDSVGCV
ncbi:Hexose transporter 2 [Elsinoe australis]|uniref:Quinate transporter n=1 Tax=Elsinoe australis TaxID=40998 RepID=A0A2P7YN85_9PEZI|nr:Hexose transporter 2 [Elsinoe australis]